MIIECSSCSQELSYSTFYGLIGERLASIFANLRGSAQWDEFAKLLNTRSGGTYISPAHLRAMQEAASLDKSSPEYQRLSWDHQENYIRLAGLAGLEPDRSGLPEFVRNPNLSEIHQNFKTRSEFPNNIYLFSQKFQNTATASSSKFQ